MWPSSCLSQEYKKYYRHKGVTNKMILNRECIAKICGLLAVGRATSFQAHPPVLANCPDIQGDHTSTTLASRCKSNDKPSHHLILMGPRTTHCQPPGCPSQGMLPLHEKSHLLQNASGKSVSAPWGKSNITSQLHVAFATARGLLDYRLY